MYVVSEITGKKYPTVEACVADEKKVEAERKIAERAEKEKKLDAAWDELVGAVEKFASIAEEIDPNIVVNIKPLIRLMKIK